MSSESISVSCPSTNSKINIPVYRNFISASELKKLKLKDGSGLGSYDPGYVNTACCTSAISHIDGEKGKLTYRGYAIEELVEKSTFVEVSYLLIYGKLPEKMQLELWMKGLAKHSFIHNNLGTLMSQFRHNAHPCGMLISSMAALGTFYPEANPALEGLDLFTSSSKARDRQILRILGKVPTIAAQAYRHRIGRPYNMPMKHNSLHPLNYTENFFYMLDHLTENHYQPHPTLVKALDKIWIIHAEHGLNCSTATLRQLTSTGVDPYSAVAGSAVALYGSLHGGANEAVLRMLESIKSIENIPKFIQNVKEKKAKIFGFGHRVYKTYDPRANILKKVAYEVFEVTGTSPLLKLALELERLALSDDYFIERHLYPNVDFYSGLIYSAMQLPTDMFPVMFTIARTAGWLAHWVECLNDKESKIYRPRQIYVGERNLKYIPLADRQPSEGTLKAIESGFERRRDLGISWIDPRLIAKL
ncbi:citrate synthase-like [Schistocerca gregaria]|uniref:citrate synthase-like n=1 Tax=Schistocerca gregaria TaxID=7010 RepID=UPI00211F3486|nr:citrate synthase-like [Schistocerca gregaria]